jgi:myb proto-oncogene protein
VMEPGDPNQVEDELMMMVLGVTADAIMGMVATKRQRTRMLRLNYRQQLKGAIQMHGSKNWAAIAALVPGRTKSQCKNRWKDVLNPSIDRTSGRSSNWTEAEDAKLKDSVQTHGGKNWEAIAALVPGRRKQ